MYAEPGILLPDDRQLSHSQKLRFQPDRDALAAKPVQVQSASRQFSSLLLRRTARHALELPRVFPRHARLVPGAFAAFPEAVAFLADETGVADSAVFGAVVLFSGACEFFWSVRCCFFAGKCLVEWRFGVGVFALGRFGFGMWDEAYRSRCDEMSAFWIN